jgi:hypothetical protein
MKVITGWWTHTWNNGLLDSLFFVDILFPFLDHGPSLSFLFSFTFFSLFSIIFLNTNGPCPFLLGIFDGIFMECRMKTMEIYLMA